MKHFPVRTLHWLTWFLIAFLFWPPSGRHVTLETRPARAETSHDRDRILAALQALPTYKDDRAPELALEKRRQLEIIADAIADASREVPYPDGRQRLAAALIAKAFHETGFSLRIHRGECRIKIGECDHGESAGLWQQKTSYYLPPARWKRLTGITPENTRLAALEAARTLSRFRSWCGPNMAAVFSAYGSGLGCSVRIADAGARVKTFERVRAMLL